MASVPPPSGLTEIDYEAIEAAVTETVRGRWFLSEFARRNRLAETRELLDAMARIEAVVAAGQAAHSAQAALPAVDPSIRLLIQRIKEISSHLQVVAGDLRDAGVDESLAAAVDLQARAVAGMMRGAPPPAPREALPAIAETLPAKPMVAAMPRLPRVDAHPAASPPLPAAAPPPQNTDNADDPRLAALSGFDSLPLAKKLAMFS